jgi:hypothetical protein
VYVDHTTFKHDETDRKDGQIKEMAERRVESGADKPLTIFEVRS